MQLSIFQKNAVRYLANKKSDLFVPTKFMLPTSTYMPERADHTVRFIENLRHTKGEWYNQPFKLLPWQETIIRNIFGIIKPNGFRQITTAYVEIAKKQGKTELGAALALYMLTADGERGAEIYSCAADRAQASLIYNVAVDMISLSPALKKRLKVVASQKRIVYPAMNSFYQVLSSEAYSKHGISPTAVLFDETHVANREMMNVMLHGASDARRQPVNFLITTAGNDFNSIGYELHQKAMDILEGRKLDPTFYPTIYAAEENDDWTDPEVWKKANPSMGITVQEEKIKIACENARQNAAEENLFKQLRLCIWVKQSVRWMQMHHWDECDFTVDPEELRGRECFAGMDLSSSIDITAFVLVFPPRNEDEKYIILPYFWIPEDNIQNRVRRDHVPYDTWEMQGYIKTTDGNVVHYGYIENFIEELGTKYNIKEIAFDRWGAVQMVQNLEGMGFTVVPFGQGYKDMSPPTKELMKLTLEKKIVHGGNPVLRWMMDNIYVKTDPAGNIKPDKEKSTEKIDGAVALIMALDRAIRNEIKGSIYDERGILIL
jgi:phage terminase large subunit-like protein